MLNFPYFTVNSMPYKGFRAGFRARNIERKSDGLEKTHSGDFGWMCCVAEAISAAYPKLHNEVISASHYIGNQLKAAMLIEANRTLVFLVDHEHEPLGPLFRVAGPLARELVRLGQ